MSEEKHEFHGVSPEDLSRAQALADRIESARGSARSGSQRLGSARLGSQRLGSQRFGSARLGSHRLSARMRVELRDGAEANESSSQDSKLPDSKDSSGDETEGGVEEEGDEELSDAPSNKDFRESQIRIHAAPNQLLDSRGHRISTAEEFNTAKGTLGTQVIRSTDQPLRRGLVANKLDSSPVFEVTFNLLLKNVPLNQANILHFAIGGSRSSMMPKISLVSGSSMLVVTIIHGSVSARMRTSPVPLNEKTKICFRLIGRLATILVNGEEEDTIMLDELLLQGVGKFYAYLSSPIENEANASVGDAVYRWKRISAQPRVQATTIFEIPENEVQVMESVKKELAMAKVWGTFDTVFGCFVFLNAVTMGIQTDCQCDDLVVWRVLEIIFLVVFIIEILGRALVAGRDEFRRMLLYDRWLQFDIFVIGATLLQAVARGEGESNGLVSLVRQVRLIKLVKSLRLMRAFRQLALLMEGLLQSMGVLFWATFLLALTLFMFGILLLQLATMNPAPSDEETQFLSNFRSLTETVWLLLKMATLDNWVPLVRQGAVEIGSLHSSALSASMMLCTFVCGFVILKVMVGMLCDTAFKLDKKTACMAGADKLWRQQRALTDLHQYMNHAGTHLLEAHQFMEAKEMLKLLEEDPYVVDLCNVFEVTQSEYSMLIQYFSEDDMVDIDGLIEALGIVLLQDYNNGQTSIDFKRPRASTALRPSDHIFFKLSLRRIEDVYQKTEKNCRCICTLACDALSILYGRMAEAGCLLPGRLDTPYVPPQTVIPEVTTQLDVRKMEEVATRFNLEYAQEQLVMPADVIFGTLIVLNAMFMFVQTLGDNDVIDGIDFAFTMSFTVEIMLKTTMAANFAYIHQAEPTDSEMNFFELAERKVRRFEKVKAGIRYKIIPPWPKTGCGGICREFALTFVSDMSSAFDVCIVFVCLMDSVVIRAVRSDPQFADMDTSMFAALRAFRLLRLAKLMRIFKLFPTLARLMNAMLVTSLQILSALGLVCFLLYAFAIAASTMIAGQNDSALIQTHFGSLYDCFTTGFQVTTFDNWDGVFTEIVSRNMIFAQLLLFFVICALALGFMNLITGLMCEAALRLNLQDEIQDQQEDLVNFLHAMSTLQKLTQQELGGENLASSFIEKAIGTHTQPSDQQNREFLMPSAMAHGESAEFTDKLKDIFAKGGLHDSLVKRVFDKVDQKRCGLISVDELTKGALVMKEDLAKVELYGCTAVLRGLRDMSTRLNRLILDTSEALQEAMTRANAAIVRQVVENRKAADLFKEKARQDGVELGSLRPDAEKALYDLSRWEAGSAATAAELRGGVLVTISGTGRVSVVGDEVFGTGTSFRTEVRPGDYIIIESKPEKPEKEKSSSSSSQRLCCAQVRLVLSQTSLKMITPLPDNIMELKVYQICRLEKPAAKLELEGFVHMPLSTKPPEPLSPRRSQQLFEWNISTRKRTAAANLQLEFRHEVLLEEKMRMELEILATLSRPLLITIVKNWKKAVRPKSKLVQFLW